MSRVLIRTGALRHNFRVIDDWMNRAGVSWTLVSKVLCGNRPVLELLYGLGVRSFGESRLENIDEMPPLGDDAEIWYLRGPEASQVEQVVRHCAVSLNSELTIIRELDACAGRLGKRHKIVIMIELGDLREGVLPTHLTAFYEQVLALENVEVMGVGSNLGCMFGAIPSVEQMAQLSLYRELLELKFGKKLPLISAGSTAALPLLLDGQMPRTINHYRIGEALFLGSDLSSGGSLPGLRTDAVEIEGRVLEVKEKSLFPMVPTGEDVSPFDNKPGDEVQPGQRGYRALVDIGNLDTDVQGLTPVESRFQIAGGSSDLLVLNVGSSRGALSIGDRVRFRPNYSALLRAMNSRYLSKHLDIRPPRHDPEQQAAPTATQPQA
ncbi:MAG: amino-acid racemase [Planctomycetes bacterium]|nr:amino-acid racemase [Planctomycetota bacterium]